MADYWNRPETPAEPETGTAIHGLAAGLVISTFVPAILYVGWVVWP